MGTTILEKVWMGLFGLAAAACSVCASLDGGADAR